MWYTKEDNRIMANGGFIIDVSNLYDDFQLYRFSDHSPIVLKIPYRRSKKAKMFDLQILLQRRMIFEI